MIHYHSLCCVHSSIFPSIPPDSVGLFGPVDAVHELCGHEVAQVLHGVRCGVYVVVAAFSVVAEAVGVLHAQVQTLNTQQNHYKTASFTASADGLWTLLTGSLDTSTDWQTSGALTSKCFSQLLTSSLVFMGQAENSLGCW